MNLTCVDLCNKIIYDIHMEWNERVRQEFISEMLNIKYYKHMKESWIWKLTTVFISHLV